MRNFIFILCILCSSCVTKVIEGYPVNEFLRPNGWNDHYYVG